jgi:hypothetical protein
MSNIRNQLTTLIVDIPHKGTTSGSFVSGARYNHVNTDATSSHTVNLVVNKLTGGVELGASLATDGEDITPFDSSSSIDVGGTGTVGDRRALETSNEAQLANGRLCGDVGGHVDGGIFVAGNIVPKAGLMGCLTFEGPIAYCVREPATQVILI